MSDYNEYAPDAVSFSFKGFDIKGFEDGTFIEVERSQPGFSKKVGSLGDVVRTASNDRTGKYTLTLQAQSAYNDILQAIADEDEKFRTGTGSINVQDHLGNMQCHSSIAWIEKRPKIDRAKEAGPTVWVFECADLEMNSGGNTHA